MARVIAMLAAKCSWHSIRVRGFLVSASGSTGDVFEHTRDHGTCPIVAGHVLWLQDMPVCKRGMFSRVMSYDHTVCLEITQRVM